MSFYLKAAILSFFVLATSACTSIRTVEAHTFKVYYTELEANFFEPPLPLEENASKIFEVNSQAITELFSFVKKNPAQDRYDDQYSRIKIVKLGTNEELTIDQNKQIIRKQSRYAVPPYLVENALEEIQKKAQSVKER